MFKPEYNRVKVWEQTEQYYKDFPEKASSIFRRRRNSEITLNEINELPRKYPKVINAPIINKDCIYVAIDYKERGFNPIILNMCSWKLAGGGVVNGAGAQEEELFRRSNYFKHLSQELYPLRGLDTTISHGVEFFRYGRDKGYTMMEKPVKIDCIGAPALRFPRLNDTEDDFEKEDDTEFMIQKIRMLLYTAAKNGNDCIILSAWGCGAYRCPPKAVAKLFKMVLGEFAGVFKETPFAVLYDNFKPFSDEFNTT